MNLQIRQLITKTAGILLVLAVVYLLAIRFVLIFSYSLDLDGAEFAFIRAVQVLLSGRPLYQDPARFPYMSVVYTPIYPYILSWISRLSGLNGIADVHYIYIIGRTISYLVFILNLVILDKFIILFNRKIFLRIFCMALFTMLQSTQIFTARPDSLQLLFFTLFVFFIFRYIFIYQNTRWLLYSILYAMLTIFTKQDSLIAVYTLLIVFVLYNRSWFAFRIMMAFTLALAFVLVLAYFTFGRFFFTNIIIYNLQVVQSFKKTYIIMVLALSLLRILPLGIVIAFLAYLKIREYPRKSPELFMTLLAMCYLVITHLLVLRAGSWFNYVYPAMLLLVVCFAMLFKPGLPWFAKIRILAFAILGFYFAGLFMLNYLFPGYIRYNQQKEESNKDKYYSILRDNNEIARLTNKDTIFLLNPTYTIIFAKQPLVFGYDIHMDRAIEVIVGFHIQSRMLFVRPEPYDSLFSNGTVQYIISENDGRGEKQIENYYKHYHYYSMIGNFTLYKYESLLETERHL